MKTDKAIVAALLGINSMAITLAQTSADAQREQQVAQQDQEKKPETPAKTPTPADAVKKVKWTGTITGGFQFSRGQTNANGVSVMGDADHASESRGYRFEGVILYATVRTPIAPNTTIQFTAQDRRDGYFTFYQNIHGPFFFVTRESIEHDVARDIKVRFMDLTGLGIRLAASKKFQAFVAPGIGFARENKPMIRDGTVFTPGVFERATYHISRIWTLDEWFQYRANPSNSHDYSMDGYLGLTGLILTKRLGFNLSYVYSYEGLVGMYGGNVVPTAPYRMLSQTTIGLRFTL